MDPVRFGRALGLGTREMAKALAKAADAATAPNPNPATPPAATPRPASAEPTRKPPTVIQTVQTLRQAHATGSTTLARASAAGRAAGKQALAPVTRAAGVLWLEVTGVFFGVFALGLGYEAWAQRANLMAQGDARLRAWGTLALAVFFVWFTVSSFIRARRRERR